MPKTPDNQTPLPTGFAFSSKRLSKLFENKDALIVSFNPQTHAATITLPAAHFLGNFLKDITADKLSDIAAKHPESSQHNKIHAGRVTSFIDKGDFSRAGVTISNTSIEEVTQLLVDTRYMDETQAAQCKASLHAMTGVSTVVDASTIDLKPITWRGTSGVEIR